MIFVKSFFVGLLTLRIAFVSFIVLAIVGLVLSGLTRPPSEGSIGWDPISIYKQSPLIPTLLIAIIFASGFLWEYRRLMRR